MKKSLFLFFVVLFSLIFLTIFAYGCGSKDNNLAVPSGLTVSFGVLSWDKVEGASGYQVCINEDYNNYVTNNSYSLSLFSFKVYDIKVKALSDGTKGNSNWSEIYKYELVNPVNLDANAVFTVSFETAGGNAIEPQTVKLNNKASKPSNPVRDNYTFDNWYKDKAFQYIFDFNTPITENSILYAKWLPVKGADITVTFITNGGNAISPVTIKAGDPYTPPKPTGGKGNFAGWFRNPSLTDSFADNTIVNDSITLYAKWSEENSNPDNGGGGNNLNNPVTVYLYENESSYTVFLQTDIEKGSVFGRPSSSPVKEGHDFIGWYESYSDIEYDFSKAVNGNLFLYAHFVPVVSGTLTGDAESIAVTMPGNTQKSYSFTPSSDSVYQIYTNVSLYVIIYEGNKLYYYCSNNSECYLKNGINYRIVLKSYSDEVSFNLGVKKMDTRNLEYNTKQENITEDKITKYQNTYFTFTPTITDLYRFTTNSYNGKDSGAFYVYEESNQRIAYDFIDNRSESSACIRTFSLQQNKKYIVALNTYYTNDNDITFDVLVDRFIYSAPAESNNQVSINSGLEEYWYKYTPSETGVYSINITVSNTYKVLLYVYSGALTYLDDYDNYYDSGSDFCLNIPMAGNNSYYLIFKSSYGSGVETIGNCQFGIKKISSSLTNGATVTINQDNLLTGVYLEYTAAESGYKTFSTTEANSKVFLRIFNKFYNEKKETSGTSEKKDASLYVWLNQGETYFVEIYFKNDDNFKTAGTAVIGVK